MILRINTVLFPFRQDVLAPKVCKRSLYEEFRNTCQLFNKDFLLNAETYGEAKQAARNYQDAKQTLFKSFEELGYGTWVNKPPEVDHFSA